MKNMTKMLLSSAILAMSPIAMGTELTNNQILENDGVININGSFTLTSADNAYLDNYGVINYNRREGDKLNLNGATNNSGIRIYTGSHFREMYDMAPTALLASEDSPLIKDSFADLTSSNFVRVSDIGRFVINTEGSDPVVLTEENLADYKGTCFSIMEGKGDIIFNNEGQGFYQFLSVEGNNDAKNIIVLRGSKDGNTVELNNSGADELFAVNTIITNSEDYLKDFVSKSDQTKTINLDKTYNLNITGMFDFKAENELFTDGKVSIAGEGSQVQISSVNSMFQSDIDVNAGELILDPQCERFNGEEKVNEETKTITLSKTMNVSTEGSIVNKGTLNIGTTGVLSLGVAG